MCLAWLADVDVAPERAPELTRSRRAHSGMRAELTRSGERTSECALNSRAPERALRNNIIMAPEVRPPGEDQPKRANGALLVVLIDTTFIVG